MFGVGQGTGWYRIDVELLYSMPAPHAMGRMAATPVVWRARVAWAMGLRPPALMP